MEGSEHAYLRNRPLLTELDRARYALARQRGHLDLFTRPMVQAIYAFTPEQMRKLEKEDLSTTGGLAKETPSVVESTGRTSTTETNN